MASLLESQLRKTIATAFKGQLLTGTLRRVTTTGLDAYGDPTGATAATFTFDGIRESFNAAFAAAAGIPITDVRILIIAGSLGTTPEQDDQIKIRDTWYQVRAILDNDPADATYVLQAFQIEDPT